MSESQQQPENTGPVTNNQWVTSMTVVIVHPKDTSPQTVQAMLRDKAMDVAERVSGGASVSDPIAVGLALPVDTDDGTDVPDWYGPEPAEETS